MKPNGAGTWSSKVQAVQICFLTVAPSSPARILWLSFTKRVDGAVSAARPRAVSSALLWVCLEWAIPSAAGKELFKLFGMLLPTFFFSCCFPLSDQSWCFAMDVCSVWLRCSHYPPSWLHRPLPAVGRSSWIGIAWCYSNRQGTIGRKTLGTAVMAHLMQWRWGSSFTL